MAAGTQRGRPCSAQNLGRLIAHSKSPKTEKAEERTPWLAFDLIPPPVAHIA